MVTQAASKTIDDAINRFMAMSPEELGSYKSATNAEAVARKLVLTATTSEDEGLAVRTSQLLTDRTDGRATAGSRKDSTGKELLEGLALAIRGAKEPIDG